MYAKVLCSTDQKAARHLREELELNQKLRDAKPDKNVEDLPPPLYKLYQLVSIYDKIYQQQSVIQMNILKAKGRSTSHSILIAKTVRKLSNEVPWSMLTKNIHFRWSWW